MNCENCKKQCDCKQREAYKRLAELGNVKCSGYEPDYNESEELNNEPSSM